MSHIESLENSINSNEGNGRCSHITSRFSTYVKLICNRSALLSVLYAQLVCICFCGTSVTSVLLQRRLVNVPLFQNFGTYFLLSVTFTVILACRPGEANLFQVLRKRWWKYLLLSIPDVESNYCVVASFKYTTATSAQILQSFTLPAVMLLSFFALKTRYKAQNYVGATLSMLGMVALILSDYISHGSTDTYATNEGLGDSLALAGALLYAIENVSMEYLLESCDIIEYLGTLVIFSTVINTIQMLILERDAIANINYASVDIVVLLIAYVLCLYIGYISLPYIIQRTSAAFYGINGLSINFYVTIVGIFALNYKLNFLYFIAFFLIIIGVLVYSLSRPSVRNTTPMLEEITITSDNDDETRLIIQSSSHEPATGADTVRYGTQEIITCYC